MAVNGSGRGASGGGSAIRAGRAYVELSADDVGLRKSLDRARAMVMKFGKGLATVGAGIAAGGAALLTPLLGSLSKVLDRNDDITRLAQKLGVSTEQLSQFGYAAETTGMSFEDLTGQFENLAERVAQGANGAGEASETFKKLGIDAAALKLQNPIDQMITLADAMQGVTNQTERLGMLSSLGGDQFQWMENLFAKGPDGIRALMSEASDVGASLDSNVAKQSQKTSQAFNRAWAAIKNSVLSVGAALLDNADTIEWVASGIVNVAKSVRNFISENKQLVGVVAAVAAGLVAVGGLLVTIGLGLGAGAMAVSGFVAALAAVKAIAVAILSPIGLIVVAVAALAAGLVYLGKLFVQNTETGRALWQTLGEGFRGLLSTFKTTWGGIVDAVRAGDLELAFSIATKGITIAWKEMLLGLNISWKMFAQKFASSMGAILDSLASLTGSDSIKAAVDRLNMFAKAGAGGVGAEGIASLAKDRAELQAELAKQVKLAADKAAAAQPPKANANLPTSEIGRFMGGARGTFSAPDYRQFFGANGIEKKQLDAQLRAAKGIEELNKRVGPLVFQ